MTPREATREALIDAMAQGLLDAQDYPPGHFDKSDLDFIMKRNRMRAEVMLDAALAVRVPCSTCHGLGLNLEAVGENACESCAGSGYVGALTMTEGEQ